MTTSAKHIWMATANRRELAKAIFFSNQIVFLIMFLFLPKLLIRHLEDFLLRGKCNKLVCFPASLPRALAAAGPARGRGRVRAGVPRVSLHRGMDVPPCLGAWALLCCCSGPGATSSTQHSGHRRCSPTQPCCPAQTSPRVWHPSVCSVCSPLSFLPEHKERDNNCL